MADSQFQPDKDFSLVRGKLTDRFSTNHDVFTVSSEKKYRQTKNSPALQHVPVYPNLQ